MPPVDRKRFASASRQALALAQAAAETAGEDLPVDVFVFNGNLQLENSWAIHRLPHTMV